MNSMQFWRTKKKDRIKSDREHDRDRNRGRKKSKNKNKDGTDKYLTEKERWSFPIDSFETLNMRTFAKMREARDKLQGTGSGSGSASGSNTCSNRNNNSGSITNGKSDSNDTPPTIPSMDMDEHSSNFSTSMPIDLFRPPAAAIVPCPLSQMVIIGMDTDTDMDMDMVLQKSPIKYMTYPVKSP